MVGFSLNLLQASRIIQFFLSDPSVQAQVPKFVGGIKATPYGTFLVRSKKDEWSLAGPVRKRLYILTCNFQATN
ncbi:hypothetical protein GPROT1_02626 [Gammaproteobacteria bacterium]|nr:hypothetical protein GPROT1_02626 [Gammaproteobacteria bacterium]